ncbi:MAG TPA: tetratricopeptide repeat protein [Candidatus Polarisedimenticolia bacterium]|nr:tetratricopeptide repeat protein [Candidatus Polarisedimenticolia bacterium]
MEPLPPPSGLVLLAAGLLVAGAGAAAGWWAARALRWWHRDEEDTNHDFARHYTEGITHFIAGRRDEAIEELTRAARLRTDVAGLYLILGDLYREKGLFDRAIRVHSGLMGRQELTRAERAQAQASLGEDFRTAGLVERSREAYRKALDLDGRNLPALRAMSRFCIEDRQWERALELEEQIIRLDRTRKNRPLAFIYNEIGREQLRQGNERAALRHFQKAIAVDERTYPAHIFLGDLYYKEGKLRKAVEHWERVVDLEPRHLPLVFDRLEGAYEDPEIGRSIEELCRRISGRDEGNWRARVLLARLEAERGETDAAYHDLLDAARAFPRSLTVQQELWRMTLARGLDRRVIEKYLDLAKEVNEFADPFLCATCRYRSLEYLWRCPQCFEWDTFTEERPRSEPY